MTRVIVHAGFHKTGTTSLQDFLHTNRDRLAPFLRYYGKAEVHQTGTLARVYAQRPFPWRLWQFRKAFRGFLAGLDPGGTIVLSREDFSGAMPGHRRFAGRMVMGYDRAPQLAQVIVDELRNRFGPRVEILFFYTTRARETWIGSVHGHLLRSINLGLGLEAFQAQFSELPSPLETARQMADVLAPVAVLTAALEDYRDHRFGPGAALLDLVGVPQAARQDLTPAPRSNVGQPPELRDHFLVLNRQNIPKQRLKRLKRALIDEAKP